MGISYDSGTETITVTGGSWDEPYTMAILDTDGTAGGYITPGGYGNREYTVGKNLVIGSDDGTSTFFDPTRAIVKMADGYTLTVYPHALRGGNLRDSNAALQLGAEKPPLGEFQCNYRIGGVLKMHVEFKGLICPSTGTLVSTIPANVLTASAQAVEALGAASGASGEDEWDPCEKIGTEGMFIEFPPQDGTIADGLPQPYPQTPPQGGEGRLPVPRQVVVLVKSDGEMC